MSCDYDGKHQYSGSSPGLNSIKFLSFVNHPLLYKKLVYVVLNMAEVDETRVRESMDRETSVRVEIVGSDDVEITKSETTEREVEITSDSDKLEETDGMLILTKSEDHIKISSGRIKVSHNVKQLVARYETATAVAAPINSYPYDTSGPDWHDEQSDKELYIHANDVAKNGIVSYVGQATVL